MKKAGYWKKPLDLLIHQIESPPVLVDVGASGQPPSIWEFLAPYSVFVGFDADRRDISDETGGGFRRRLIINQAVTAGGEGAVRFFLTEFPQCSSTLQPDTETVSDYLFADLFRIQDEIQVPAVSLDSTVQDLKLERIDWLKVDSQGTDLRLYRSLAAEIRNGLLAVDLEPGLIPVYRGEDVFAEVHGALTSEGFWLSRLPVYGSPRIGRASVELLKSDFPGIQSRDLEDLIRFSPLWCEPRYLREIDWLKRHKASRRQFKLLWIFAILDEQPGFAMDVASQYLAIFGEDESGRLMLTEPARFLAEARNRRGNAGNPGFRLLRKFIPRRVKDWIKSQICRESD